ncbi:MAG: hypothetical protein QXF01_00365 [Candidatus Micrarchaeaceae archaeon]
MHTHNYFTTYAPAKLNITLRIGGLREDGYHDVTSTMQAVVGKGITDYLELHKLGKPGECGANALGFEDVELVLKAARRLEAEIATRLPALLVVKKSIPPFAGLGGGSSDAAAALRLINYAFDLQFSAQELARIAADIGNDIPFCVFGGRAEVSMAGRRIGSIKCLDKARQVAYVIVTNTDVHLKTEEMYSQLDRSRKAGGSADRRSTNDFEELAFSYSPISMELLDAMRREGDAVESGLTGKGPTVFAGYSTAEEAHEVKNALRNRICPESKGINVFVAEQSHSFLPS